MAEGRGVSHDKARKKGRLRGVWSGWAAGVMNVDIYPKSNACLISHLKLMEHVGENCKVWVHKVQSVKRKKKCCPEFDASPELPSLLLIGCLLSSPQ